MQQTLNCHKGCKQLQGGVHMVSVSSWNIRGLNWPNKQEDVHSFLQFNKVGLIGLLETKVKEKNLKEDLWVDLQTLTQSINEAWCILGGFNNMLYKDDRKGGTEDHEVNDLTNLIEQCDLQELRWIGSYFSWSNKRVWSRIDRVFTNVLWYEIMDFTQTHYLPSSLSDHTPLLIQFSSSPRPLARFQFCDMWIKHKDFSHRLASIPSSHTTLPKMQHLKIYLDKLRPKLELTTLQSKLTEDSSNAHLIQQEQDLKKKYIDIISSSISLIQQQSKIGWIKYGDDNTRLFHTRARQRKLSSYIYSLADDGGRYVEGFD
ncbi:LOW QUALITY PROTEIN: hypothetical protein Cgig2_028801 [Carnegiea gigantea]|uniref:Endonuclease/exonuclease/phosphatase domain-containing protein n=1 Tax=Carnegiea gigantea TaxID=171969 RepID=A0A9Q1GG47_9CARY|nr:LOW QUALITY PROTEIN: hypothetical protein Cgig2_028801 [Carnegiea gigantea]